MVVETRKTRKRPAGLAAYREWDDISLGDSDDNAKRTIPKKRVRPVDSSDSERHDTPDDSQTDDDEAIGSSDDFGDRPRRSKRQKRTRDNNRSLRRRPHYTMRVGSSESDESEDELNLRRLDVPRKRGRPSRLVRLNAPAKIITNFGSRRSDRVRHNVNMKEVEADDPWTPDSGNPTAPIAPKPTGAREVFQPLPRGDSFRERHCQTCEVCGNTNYSAGTFVYCQGCSLAYHKSCLGHRGGREHLVTKVAEDDFVLQCRRCINFPRRKDVTAPDHARCQDCKTVGRSCKAFRSRKTPAQEQREREDNHGVDPTTEVNPILINNPNNVMFRCNKCSRPFHYHHLPPRTQYSSAMNIGYTDEERAAARYSEYSHDFKCKECLEIGSKKVATIVAWRPVDVETYIAGTAIEFMDEDDVEYLIKWENSSYFQVTWMPGAWVWGVAAHVTRTAFAKKNPPMKVTTEAAVPEEYLRIDIVLDVKYTNVIDIRTADIDRARIREVGKALIKYKGLGYEEAVWEGVPEPEDGDRWTDWVTAYNDWVLGRYTHLPKVHALKARLDKVRSQDFINLEKTKQPENVTGGELMKYQVDGLNWIYHQWHNMRNGILADEMGLGKTIQVIAFLAMMVQDHNCYPFLIVVPNSTCPNWRREIKQWAPSLRVVAYYGSSTARQMAYNYELYPGTAKERRDLRCHIVVTSYESVIDVSGGKFFKNVPWQGLIVDEGQRLKNDKGMLHSTLSSWKIPFRLLLSGTPLQNNARELFNLLQFLDDSINAAAMEEEYAEMSRDKILKLHDLIRPYILRRTKAQVLTFLPPMGQIIIPVSMSMLQKKLYKSILAKNPALLRALFNATSLKAQERANLNNILMQLRKCLCHPFVYSQHIEERQLQAPMLHRNLVEASSKLQLLELLLPKLKARSHRVLIFSQFLDMLNIIEDFLDGLEMRYQRLDGSVNSLEKQKRIDEFNAPNSPLFAFLLSTRAGGVGINLATADTVIVLDPDFNPHQDIQAISRAHRIGQTKKVLCFQLMTRRSAEEKIVQIGRKKMALDHIVVDQLDAEDLEDKDVESILRHGAAALFNDDENDKDIRYDDASVELLLDRSQIENTKSGTDQSAESSFSFARVWANKEEKLEDSLESSEEETPPDPSLWEKIIKERERAAAEEAAARAVAFGRGKRARAVDIIAMHTHISVHADIFQAVDYAKTSPGAQEDREDIGSSGDEKAQDAASAKDVARRVQHESDTDFRAESEDDREEEDFIADQQLLLEAAELAETRPVPSQPITLPPSVNMPPKVAQQAVVEPPTVAPVSVAVKQRKGTAIKHPQESVPNVEQHQGSGNE
jgi:chromodomain-helicase-DNA-binding protein 4